MLTRLVGIRCENEIYAGSFWVSVFVAGVISDADAFILPIYVHRCAWKCRRGQPAGSIPPGVRRSPPYHLLFPLFLFPFSSLEKPGRCGRVQTDGNLMIEPIR